MTSDHNPTVCRERSCDAAIVFVPQRHAGATMCLEAEPHPKGNVWVERLGDEDVSHAQVLGAGAAKAHRAARLPLFRAHQAACPGRNR